MGRSRVSIHLVGEPCVEVDSCFRELLAHGFAAERTEPDDIATTGKSDIVVIAGPYRPAFHLPVRLSGLLGDRKARTILFLADMDPESFIVFEQTGFAFINITTDLSAKRLIGLIADVDPGVVYQASKTAAMRASLSNKVAHTVVDLFSRLRANPVAPATEEAASQRRAMGELIGKSPMSVWIDLIQNYHDGTAQHCSLVSGYTLAFARALGVGEQQTGRLFDAAFFHDVGKAMIPLEILDKPGRLDAAEWEVMKRHPLHSFDILSRDGDTSGEIARVARDHHEYLDGTGYPNGLKAREIDDVTRIITICDIFAALTEKRAYKAPKPLDEAYAVLVSLAGTKLDPDLVRVFERVVAEYDGGLRPIASAA